MSAASCARCAGQFWVCEDHDSTPWGEGDGCCGAPGMPCPDCNGPRYDDQGRELMPYDTDGAQLVPNLLYPPRASGLPE